MIIQKPNELVGIYHLHQRKDIKAQQYKSNPDEDISSEDITEILIKFMIHD